MLLADLSSARALGRLSKGRTVIPEASPGRSVSPWFSFTPKQAHEGVPATVKKGAGVRQRGRGQEKEGKRAPCAERARTPGEEPCPRPLGPLRLPFLPQRPSGALCRESVTPSPLTSSAQRALVGRAGGSGAAHARSREPVWGSSLGPWGQDLS